MATFEFELPYEIEEMDTFSLFYDLDLIEETSREYILPYDLGPLDEINREYDLPYDLGLVTEIIREFELPYESDNAKFTFTLGYQSTINYRGFLYSDIVLDRDPIAFYRLDGDSSSLLDSSGNGNHGFLIGSPVFYNDLGENTGGDYEILQQRISDINGYSINVYTANAVRFLNNTAFNNAEELTAEIWYRYQGSSSTLISIPINASRSRSIQISVGENGIGVSASIYSTISDSEHILSAPWFEFLEEEIIPGDSSVNPPIPDLIVSDGVFHVVLTINFVTGESSLYIDSEEVASDTFVFPENSLKISSAQYVTVNRTNTLANIDNVAFYGHALSHLDVQENYETGLVTEPSSFFFYMPYSDISLIDLPSYFYLPYQSSNVNLYGEEKNFYTPFDSYFLSQEKIYSFNTPYDDEGYNAQLSAFTLPYEVTSLAGDIDIDFKLGYSLLFAEDKARFFQLGYLVNSLTEDISRSFSLPFSTVILEKEWQFYFPYESNIEPQSTTRVFRLPYTKRNLTGQTQRLLVMPYRITRWGESGSQYNFLLKYSTALIHSQRNDFYLRYNVTKYKLSPLVFKTPFFLQRIEYDKSSSFAFVGTNLEITLTTTDFVPGNYIFVFDNGGIFNKTILKTTIGVNTSYPETNITPKNWSIVYSGATFNNTPIQLILI